MTATSPRFGALVDQVQAAQREARTILDQMAATSVGPVTRREPGPVSEPLLASAHRQLYEHRGRCRHLHAATPEPVYWQLWRARRLVCASCAVAEARRIRGITADHRCDACGRRDPKCAAVAVLLSAVVDPEQQRCWPAVLAVFGLCRRCAGADQPDPAP